MNKQVIPEIPILDTDIYSPYRSATVKSCTRVKTGIYLLITSLLDTFYVNRLYMVGDTLLYKIKKVVSDGKCINTIEK